MMIFFKRTTTDLYGVRGSFSSIWHSDNISQMGKVIMALFSDGPNFPDFMTSFPRKMLSREKLSAHHLTQTQ